MMAFRSKIDLKIGIMLWASFEQSASRSCWLFCLESKSLEQVKILISWWFFPLKESRPPLSLFWFGDFSRPATFHDTGRYMLCTVLGSEFEYECLFRKSADWPRHFTHRGGSNARRGCEAVPFDMFLMWICLVFADRRGGCSNVSNIRVLSKQVGKVERVTFLPSTYHWSHRMGKSAGIPRHQWAMFWLPEACWLPADVFFFQERGLPDIPAWHGLSSTLSTPRWWKLMSTDCKAHRKLKSTFLFFVGVEMRAV